MKLTNCYVQKTQDSDFWVVFSSDGDRLLELPGRLDEHEVMNIVHYIRKVEEESKQEGIESAKLSSENDITNLKISVEFLTEENRRLSVALENLIVGSAY